MSISENDKALIKESFILIDQNSTVFSRHFYDCLFTLEPMVKPLFKAERNLIEKHFITLITLCVKKIDNFSEMNDQLFKLGQAHRYLKVKESQLAIVRKALVLSIEYELRSKCTPSIINAWSNYIDLISAQMIAGLNSEAAL